MTTTYFSDHSLTFLAQLAKNNHRDWFEQHKQDYEERVRTPALHFIEDMAADLAAISPHFLAVPRKVGGSLMRVYRDVRFGKDKRPFKTNIGIQFRHERGKDVHAPGFYVHIEPQECFVGVGIWRPDAPALAKIRMRIVEHPGDWLAARDAKPFGQRFERRGDALKNPPRGIDKAHPLVDDLKCKDFIAVAPMTPTQVISPVFKTEVVNSFEQAVPYMRFLCRALDLSF